MLLPHIYLTLIPHRNAKISKSIKNMIELYSQRGSRRELPFRQFQWAHEDNICYKFPEEMFYPEGDGE